MTVVELWNMWSNWLPFVSIKMLTDGGDSLGSFNSHEDVLKKYANNKVYAFSYDPIGDNVIIAIEV